MGNILLRKVMKMFVFISILKLSYYNNNNYNNNNNNYYYLLGAYRKCAYNNKKSINQ